MCGIFGVFGDRPAELLASRVVAALKHRGPDDEGVRFFDNGMMAHTRLSIIDLSPMGRQPMSNAQQTLWITYNGEIYNYRELRQELEATYPFRTQSDTEVILAAYTAWGTDCLSRLRGMFAFGLWDAQRKLLLCATDRFSIKPLYYAWDAQRIRFASEIKPLALAGAPLRPNEALLHDYLALGLLDHSQGTLFEGIKQLRPGTFLTVCDGRLSVERYWDLHDLDQPADRQAPDLLERADAILREAVRLHLRGDVEVGLSLSSGLDSNLLRWLMLESLNGSRRLQCFTFSFPGTPYDEWADPSQRSVANHCDYRMVAVEPSSLLDGLLHLVRVMEGPVGGLSIYGYWINAQAVAARGVKVLLDGQGADELFAGYRYYYELWLRQLLQDGHREQAEREFNQFRAFHGEPGRSLTDWLETSSPPGATVLAPDSTSLTSHYVHPDFSAAFSSRHHDFTSSFSCPVKEAMYRDLFFLKIPKLLRFQDKCAMAWGVEVRVPYLDHELAECLAGAPTGALLRDGAPKALLRSIAQRLPLAEAMIRAPKLYVAAPQREWIKGPLQPGIRTLMQDSVLAQRRYIDSEALVRQFDQYVASPELGNSFFAWKFLNLEFWYRTFFS